MDCLLGFLLLLYWLDDQYGTTEDKTESLQVAKPCVMREL